ncbi:MULTISPECIES: hypothetical protein [unclassified Mesorhizobium]|uniref:hypothetical protein n=1 Tax=unclassified Mesorhizobium TaxID=325217 RepID=UPI0015E2C7D0|nr:MULTISPECIES: hypothetical protein [unclassified Mesorhizobium]
MRKEKNGISVHAIAGTHTVLFGMDATEEARRGLLGFALGKRKPSGNIAWMNGFKVFEETRPNPEPGTLKPTNEHPIQDFQWSDYNAEPGGEAADYVIRPLYGAPAELVPGADIEMTVATLNAPGARHHVYFNRGTVPGQAFARQFGKHLSQRRRTARPGQCKGQMVEPWPPRSGVRFYRPRQRPGVRAEGRRL